MYPHNTRILAKSDPRQIVATLYQGSTLTMTNYCQCQKVFKLGWNCFSQSKSLKYLLYHMSLSPDFTLLLMIKNLTYGFSCVARKYNFWLYQAQLELFWNAWTLTYGFSCVVKKCNFNLYQAQLELFRNAWPLTYGFSSVVRKCNFSFNKHSWSCLEMPGHWHTASPVLWGNVHRKCNFSFTKHSWSCLEMPGH